MSTTDRSTQQLNRKDMPMTEMVFPSAINMLERGRDKSPAGLNVLAVAIAHDFVEFNAFSPEDIEGEDAAEKLHEEFTEGLAYERIEEVVQNLDADQQLAVIEGNSHFFDEFGFEGQFESPKKQVEITAIHCIREVVWSMFEEAVGIDTERTRPHDLL